MNWGRSRPPCKNHSVTLLERARLPSQSAAGGQAHGQGLDTPASHGLLPGVQGRGQT